MLCITSSLLALFFIPLWTKTIQEDQTYIAYSPEEMAAHKQQWCDAIRSNPAKRKSRRYQMKRTLLTISGNDADYIPKVINAGEVYTDGPTPYQVMHNGIKVALHAYYDAVWLTDIIYGLKGHHEPQEEKCFYEVLKYIPENATMIELGSYWAYYSLWFALRVEGAKNYMIEPDPRRLEIGKKNYELNNQTGSFFRGYVGKMTDGDPDITGADQISIDDFIEKQNIERVHILHSDIQGAEFSMLETTVKSLDKIDYFFVSTHSDKVHAQCLHFLKQHGFCILAEHTPRQSYSEDGLIVAKREGVAGPDTIEIQKH